MTTDAPAITEATRPAGAGGRPRDGVRARSLSLVGVALVIFVAAFLRLDNIGDGGLGNPFYAAAVRSMGHSLHNFVFLSFDELGTYMVDKPPVALWLQTLSSIAFGYGGFALVLPQAVAGIAAVAVLAWLAWRMYGELAGVAASAVLAVLPASVLVSRNNTMDTLVMALALAAVAFTLKAASSGRGLWLVLAALAEGIAFNTKGFEAFLGLPGIAVYFWLASSLPVRRRLLQVAPAAAVLVIVALSWTTAVSLVPASDRPLVLNSDANSIWHLTFVYNGVERVLGGGTGFDPASALTSAQADRIPAGVFYGGERGPLRIFGEFPGPLVAVIMPAVLAGALLLAADLRRAARRPAAALWLFWLLAGLVAFSASRLGSPHYLEAFSPALSVCAGVAGVASLARSQRRRLLGLAGLGGSAAYALVSLTELGDAGRLIEASAVLAIAAVALSAALGAWRAAAPLARASALAAALLVLAIPLAMSVQAIRDAPIEGVQPGVVLLSENRSREARYDPASYAYSFLTGKIDYLDRPLRYLEVRRRDGQYLVAMRTFYASAPVIAQRDAPVLVLYSEFRNRPELPIDVLEYLIASRKVEYFMVALGGLRATYPEAAALIESRCRTDVSRQAGLAPETGLRLLHCD